MQKIKTKKLSSRGFTLIELLIVIIIIGILAAIAFVAYTGSQNKAHQADAQSTLAEVKNKLGEYNANNGNYPASQAALDTFISSSAGGNNSALAAKFVTANGYTYAPNDGNGGACDNTTTQCSGYTLTASKSIWSGTSDLTVTN